MGTEGGGLVGAALGVAAALFIVGVVAHQAEGGVLDQRATFCYDTQWLIGGI